MPLVRDTSASAKSRGRHSNAWGYVRERDGRFTGHAIVPGTHKYQTQTFGTEHDAEAWARKRHAELVCGVAPISPDPTAPTGGYTLRQAADAFIVDLRLRDGCPEGIANDERIVKQAIDAGISDLTADGVPDATRLFLLNLKRKNGQPASGGTRNTYLGTLRKVAAFAVMQGKIPTNPFKLVSKVPRIEAHKPVFELDEMRMILDPKNERKAFYPFFATMSYIGLRGIEASKMDWSWFKWQAERVEIQVSRKPRAERQAGDMMTKNRRARFTDLPPEYAEIMRNYAGGNPPAKGPVFPELNDGDRDRRIRRFEEFVDDCGVELNGRTPHSCRHTWTCLKLASGEQEILVKQIAGHSEREMTEHYGKHQQLFVVQVRKEGWKPGDMWLRRAPVSTKPKRSKLRIVEASSPQRQTRGRNARIAGTNR